MTEVSTRPGPELTRFGQIHLFESLDSTNRLLVELAQSGAPEGTVVVARHQTEGRGRHGRRWDSKPGSSLLFSVLFRPADEAVHRYGQAVALAVSDACQIYAGFATQLKWPNDVLVGERKIAGVLSEVSTEGADVGVVVGCGININWHGELPSALEDSAISADEAAGQLLDIDVMLDRILRALEERLRNMPWVAEAYRQRCSTIGSHVRVEWSEGSITGTALDVTDDGAIVIEIDGGQGRVVLTSAEVVHVRAF